MIVNLSPSPFPAGVGFEVHVLGGTPPYAFEIKAPPNPPGTSVTVYPPNTAVVNVPPNTPVGTQVTATVTDSSDPKQTAAVVNRVG